MNTNPVAFTNAWKIMRAQYDERWYSPDLSLAQAINAGLLEKDWDCDGPFITPTDLYCEALEQYKELTDRLYAEFEAAHPPEPEFKFGLSIKPNEVGRDGQTVTEWCLWGHGEYGRESVLEGQARDVRLEFSRSVDVLKQYAAENYPDLPVQVSDSFPLPSEWGPSMPEHPPAWFSPANAGEEW